MRLFGVLAAVNGALAVATGAFGAHGLRNSLSERHLAIFETGARYHMYHALALLAVALLARRGAAVSVAGWCFTGGIVVFSGSLYLLAITGIGALGAITPIGGVALLVGWIALATSLARL